MITHYNREAGRYFCGSYVQSAVFYQQVKALREKVSQYEERILGLKAAADMKHNIQDSLISITQSLAALYHLLCEANNETPNRSVPLCLIVSLTNLWLDLLLHPRGIFSII